MMNDHHTVHLNALAYRATQLGAPLRLFTNTMESISLQDWYAGQKVFLILSGPSARDLDLSLLNQRGIITFGVNNSWALHRPHLWTAVDPPSSFLDKGWMDPGIIKFVPLPLGLGHLHTREEDGSFRRLSEQTQHMPSVFFYPRRDTFNHKTFLTEGYVSWGQHKNAPDSLQIRGCRSVMLAAMRLICYLGFKTIYLIGCDFKMTQGEQNYSFPEDRDEDAIKNNNNSYQVLNERFKALLPEFQAAGITVKNCNPASGLTAFEFIDYEDAVEEAAAPFRNIDTRGWYNQPDIVLPEHKEKRRRAEVEKYRLIFEKKPHYGHTNHGRAAMPFIIDHFKPKTLVDLGCGWNEFCKEARELGIEAIGVDLACPGADIVAPMHKVPLRQRFDLVTSFDALEHCLTEEIPEIIAEMKRLSKRFIVSISYTPSINTGVRGEPLHMTVKREEWWVRQFEKAGASVSKHGRYLYGEFNG